MDPLFIASRKYEAKDKPKPTVTFSTAVENKEQRAKRLSGYNESQMAQHEAGEYVDVHELRVTMENQLTRKAAFVKYGDELIAMRDVKKGTRYRKWLYRILKVLADKVFEDEDEEYERTGKFGRGIWYNVHNTFKTKVEMDLITTVATAYGAFSY